MGSGLAGIVANYEQIVNIRILDGANRLVGKVREK
jgi:hypothetical protein